MRKARTQSLYDSGLTSDRIAAHMGWIPGTLMIHTYLRSNGTCLFEPQTDSAYATLARRVAVFAWDPNQLDDNEEWIALQQQ